MKKISVLDVYTTIAKTREALKEGTPNINDEKTREKWQEVINSYSWVMSLLEQTEEVNPSK
jgi:hypothetical protein